MNSQPDIFHCFHAKAVFHCRSIQGVALFALRILRFCPIGRKALCDDLHFPLWLPIRSSQIGFCKFSNATDFSDYPAWSTVHAYPQQCEVMVRVNTRIARIDIDTHWLTRHSTWTVVMPSTGISLHLQQRRLHPYLLTHSTQRRPSSEANRLSASQETPNILWNMKVH
jgi:hypothetical protein